MLGCGRAAGSVAHDVAAIVVRLPLLVPTRDDDGDDDKDDGDGDDDDALCSLVAWEWRRLLLRTYARCFALAGQVIAVTCLDGFGLADQDKAVICVGGFAMAESTGYSRNVPRRFCTGRTNRL